MNWIARGSGLALALLLPSVALAQDSFQGRYALEGRYSNRKATSATVTISGSSGALKVERVGRFTSGPDAARPPFTWKSTSTRVVSARVLRATFRLGPTNGLDGAVAALGADASDDALAGALAGENVLEAVYVLSSDKRSLREVIVNTTRLGDQARWTRCTTSGRRLASTPVGPISAAELRRRVDAELRRWHREYTEETYADLLASASAAERPDLLRQRDEDLRFEDNEVIAGDDVFEEQIDERYDDGDPYRAPDGQAVPRASVKVYVLSMFPAHAGIGLSKTFAFDARSGALLDEGELQD